MTHSQFYCYTKIRILAWYPSAGVAHRRSMFNCRKFCTKQLLASSKLPNSLRVNDSVQQISTKSEDESKTLYQMQLFEYLKKKYWSKQTPVHKFYVESQQTIVRCNWTVYKKAFHISSLGTQNQFNLNRSLNLSQLRSEIGYFVELLEETSNRTSASHSQVWVSGKHLLKYNMQKD